MKPEELPVFPSSDELAKAAEQGILTLRVRAADALLTHYQISHGNVGEHDHHCIARRGGDPCSCGWSYAQWAIERYEEAALADRVSEKT